MASVLAGLGGLPSFTGMNGQGVQGGQQAGTSTENVAEVGPQNPMQVAPEEAYFSTGKVSKEDQKMLVDTLSDYRNSWAQDRLSGSVSGWRTSSTGRVSR